jgi:hypothetical protein
MSLSSKVLDNIDNTVKNFINNISNKYKLDEAELLSMWVEKNSMEKPIKIKKEIVLDSELAENLLKLSKKDLSDMCKSRNIKVSGTKNELIQRIISYDENDGFNPIDTNKISNVVTSKKTTSPSKTKTVQQKPAILKKLESKIPSIVISRNSFGNFEHKDTSFVFNNKTQKVIGKQNSNGTISELTAEDINICHKYKFNYIIPENLNKSNKNDAVDEDESDVEEVEEIDDDDDIEIDEEVEIEDDCDEEYEYYED